MNTDARLGTVDAILALFPEASRELARRARELIEELDPGAFEVPRLGEKTTTYGVGPSKMKEAYAYVMPQNGYVNLGFFHGAALPDPAGLLEGSGKSIRHVKIRQAADLASPELRALLTHAIADRRAPQAAART